MRALAVAMAILMIVSLFQPVFAESPSALELELNTPNPKLIEAFTEAVNFVSYDLKYLKPDGRIAGVESQVEPYLLKISLAACSTHREVGEEMCKVIRRAVYKPYFYLTNDDIVGPAGRLVDYETGEFISIQKVERYADNWFAPDATGYDAFTRVKNHPKVIENLKNVHLSENEQTRKEEEKRIAGVVEYIERDTNEFIGKTKALDVLIHPEKYGASFSRTDGEYTPKIIDLENEYTEIIDNSKVPSAIIGSVVAGVGFATVAYLTLEAAVIALSTPLIGFGLVLGLLVGLGIGYLIYLALHHDWLMKMRPIDWLSVLKTGELAKQKT